MVIVKHVSMCYQLTTAGQLSRTLHFANTFTNTVVWFQVQPYALIPPLCILLALQVQVEITHFPFLGAWRTYVVLLEITDL